MKSITKTVLLTAMAALALYLSACNTTKGAGKDMQSAGENISHAAEKGGAHQ
jgi:predicted small secreted protein